MVIGNICEISIQEDDTLVNFMHPNGSASSFHWPEKKDSCWVPMQHVVTEIPGPTVTSTARKYILPQVVTASVDKRLR